MSDNEFCSDSDSRREAWVDAMLRQRVRSENGIDEDFLAEMEAAIDADSEVLVEFPKAKPALKPWRPLAWSAAVAVAVVFIGVGGLTLYSLVDSAPSPSHIRPTIYASVVDADHDDPIELEQLARPIPINENNLTKDRVIRRELPDSHQWFGYYAENSPPIEMNSRTTLNPYIGYIGTPADYGIVNESILPNLSDEARSQSYSQLVDNQWFEPFGEPLSTFSTDVDTASWTNLRGMIRSGLTAEQIPDDAVRIEEMINYFDWNYPQPDGDHPFSFHVEAASCPWNTEHQILRVGVKGKEIPKADRPVANLVFLLDVSGSMNQPNKLPLVKKSISVLVEELNERDRVSIVVYAGSEGVALAPTSGFEKAVIADALNRLKSGGSTNGGAGIKLAYKLAKEQFVKEGINRVILCTDGDFNVGLTANETLAQLVEKEAKSEVYLSVFGFGNDNLNDGMLEEITNRGNGNYFFIDSLKEARKVLLRDLMGTLVAIAKDVKIQIEFNPTQVAKYRLIGYANRKLKAEDFRNDEVDAGEVGAGHSVTALYEIVPANGEGGEAGAPTLRYQRDAEREIIPSDELALLKLRYKQPDSDVSTLMSQPVLGGKSIQAKGDHAFASSVAMLGLLLREHESVKGASFDQVIELAEKGKGSDPHGYRTEFIDLVKILKASKGVELNVSF